MSIQNAIEDHLPEAMTIFGDWALEQGAEPEDAFMVAHCAFAALMSLKSEAWLEHFPTVSFLGNTSKDIPGLIQMREFWPVLVYMSLPIWFYLSALACVTLMLVTLFLFGGVIMGCWAQNSERWLELIGANKKSYPPFFPREIDKSFIALKESKKSFMTFADSYLVSCEYLNLYVDQLILGPISQAKASRYLNDLQALTAHLPFTVRDKLVDRAQAAMGGSKEAMIELVNFQKQFLRPSGVDVGKAASLAIILLVQHKNIAWLDEGIRLGKSFTWLISQKWGLGIAKTGAFFLILLLKSVGIALLNQRVARQKAFAWEASETIGRIQNLLERRGLFVDPALKELSKPQWFAQSLGEGHVSLERLKKLMEEVYPCMLEKRSFAAPAATL